MTLSQQALFTADDAGHICTGIVKLAQNWVIEFLTELGSKGYHQSTRGTAFITLAKTGQLTSEATVQLQFSFAAIRVAQNLAAAVTEQTPADERLASAVLERLTLADNQLVLHVRLQSEAGDSKVTYLPVPTSLPSIAAYSEGVA